MYSYILTGGGKDIIISIYIQLKGLAILYTKPLANIDPKVIFINI
jgi:hypothetical protein